MSQIAPLQGVIPAYSVPRRDACCSNSPRHVRQPYALSVDPFHATAAAAGASNP